MSRRGLGTVHVAFAALLVSLFTLFVPMGASAVTLPVGFEQTAVLPGVAKPQDVAIAPNGRVFVAEKSGLIRTFDNIDDTTATLFADLRTQVHNYAARGLLSIVVDPGFPAKPYVYVFYTLDAPIGGTPPVYGGTSSFDNCNKATGGLDENCMVGSRISRLQVAGDVMTGAEKVLVEDYCQQYPAHAAGGLAFGADGKLYASGGDGSTSAFWDYGQTGTPANPCGDPGGSSPTPPTSEAGRLRAQDLRTTGDPTSLDGSLIRIDPATGAAAAGNPLAGPDANAKRILAYGFRDASKIAVRPGTSDIWVADRGGGYWEEFNRVASAGAVKNFGWPCYEGGLDANGNPFNRIRPKSEEQNLSICQGLYNAGNAVTAPYWGYDHELPVTSGEDCEQDSLGSPFGSTLSGATFYPAAGGNFPPMYGKALFFADRLRSCIWALLPGADGLPKRGSVVPFAGMAGRATDLEVSPTGGLVYIDQKNDTVQLISYTLANNAPTAVATSDVTSGGTPLQVAFSGLSSTDPDAGDTLTYAWDLDGDNLLDDSTAAQPTFNYETPGTYTVTLKVTDSKGAFSLATVVITVQDSGLKTLRFSPVADSYVDSANTAKNYGTVAKLRTDGSPAAESLLRFNVAGVPADAVIQSAKLRVRSLADGTADGPALYTAAGGWTETGVKWSNRPAFSAATGDKAAVAANSLVEFDVKSLITANGELNLGLRQPGSDNLDLASREDADATKRPELVINYTIPAPDPGPGPGPGPQPNPQPDPKPKTTPLGAAPVLGAPVVNGSKPSLLLAAAGIQHVLANKAIVVVGSCGAPCTLKASASVSLAGASRALKLRGVSRSAGSGKQVTLRLKLSGKTLRAVRRALRRGKKVIATVTVTATDAAGASSTAKRKITLKR